MRTLIVVPAYNESENIRTVLDSLSHLPLQASVVVVDDGSSDDTDAIVKSTGVMVIKHASNLGYGAALQTGYKYAVLNDYDYVIQFDGDGQHNPADIPAIYHALVNSGADMVIGTRFSDEWNFQPGALKHFAIRVFRFVIKLITHKRVTDPTSGLKGLTRRVFTYYARANRIPSDFPDADFVIDVLLRNWTIEEVPIHHQPRLAGTSMHSGFKPAIYVAKVLLSIVGITLEYAFNSRGSHS